MILGLVDWFQDAPESPSIIRATLARVSGPAPASPSATESEQGRTIEQPLSKPPAAASHRAAEVPRQPVSERFIAGEAESAMPELPAPELDYPATLRGIVELDARKAGAQPRVRRIVEDRTETSEDDWYLESWRRKVERIGKLNYPEQARARKIYGSLRLLVAIEPDGALRDVRVIDSSGHQVLDDAAVRIVRLAAPYAPFPSAMREETDVLEIVRTWQFRKRGSASSS